MLRKAFAVAVVAVCLSAPAPVFADDAMPDSGGGRYTFNKTTDGVVRLDTQTGQVALCTQRTVGWACQMAPEDRTALEGEIARLRSENATLKQSLLSHGLALPPGTVAEAPGDHGTDITIHLPSDSDVDRGMAQALAQASAYADRVWRNFVDAVARAQRQMLNKS
jgi:hypothetical protein